MASLTCDICLEEYGDNDRSEKAQKYYPVDIYFVVNVFKQQ